MREYNVENLVKKVISVLYAAIMLSINVGKVAIHLFEKTRNKNKIYSIASICGSLIIVGAILKFTAFVSPASMIIVGTFSFLTILVIGIYALAEIRGF